MEKNKKICSKRVFTQLEKLESCAQCTYKWATEKKDSGEFVYLAMILQKDLKKLSELLLKYFVKI